MRCTRKMRFAEGTPTVDITLGGKDYTLGYTIGAMKRAKELNVLDIDTADSVAFMLALPAFVWACMDEEARKELSVSAIEELTNPLNIHDISTAVGELFSASLPKPDPNVEPAAVTMPTAGNSASKNSGRLESMTSA